MTRLFVLAVAAITLSSVGPSIAQTYHDRGGTVVPGVVVVDPTDNSGPLFTSGNPGKISGTFSASLSGFQPASVLATPITVTTSGATATLPSGTVVVASNAGSSNAAYCALGSSSSTSQQPIPPGGWFAFTVGSATQMTCVTSSSTTTVNLVGGSGLPTGSGGGGGGGGGSVPTGSAGSPNTSVVSVQGIGSMTPIATSAASSAFAAGSIVDIGNSTSSTTPYAGSGDLTVLSGLAGIYAAAAQLHTDLSGPTPAGTHNIGSIDIFGNTGSALDSAAGTANSQAVTIQGNSSGIAVPISAAALPLPTGAALETGGNLATVATAQGTGATGISQPTGGSGVLGWLSGIYNKLSGTLTVSGTVGISGTPGMVPTPVAGVGATPIEKAGLTNSAVSVKASAGTLLAVNCDNPNSSSEIVEFFNTSSVTLGTTAPVWHVAVPAGGGGSNLPVGVALGGSAIYVAAVTAYGGTSAPGTTLNCAIGYI